MDLDDLLDPTAMEQFEKLQNLEWKQVEDSPEKVLRKYLNPLRKTGKKKPAAARRFRGPVPLHFVPWARVAKTVKSGFFSPEGIPALSPERDVF